MPQEWPIEARTGVCAVSGRKLEEGEEFYTVIFEAEDALRRVDYSLDAWAGPPEGAFCSFKTRVPTRTKSRKLLVNDELLIDFFLRLEDETEAARVHFRFVLALILMRKRLLRYEETATGSEGEVWRMTLVRDRSSHRVVNPRLTDEEVEKVSAQLSAILHSDMQAWALAAEREPPPDAEPGRVPGAIP